MQKGMQIKSRNTGLVYKVEQISGDRVMVRDEDGKLINHYFEKEAFLYGTNSK